DGLGDGLVAACAMAAPPPTRAPARVRATSGFRMPNRIGSHLPPAIVAVSGPPRAGWPLGEARKEAERIRRPPTHSRLSAKVQPDPSEYCCPLTASRSADREPICGCGP